MKHFTYLWMIAIAGMLSGCATTGDRYKPATVGDLRDGRTTGGIEVSLIPDREAAHIGDPITLSVVIRNVGTQTVQFPKDPSLFLTWVYPDGKRDNLLQSASPAPAPSGSIVLRPGEQIVQRSVVKTYYFGRKGVTEFRAVLASPSDGTTLAWNGRAVSNGYGIDFNN